MEFGPRFKALLKEMNVSQSELARRLVIAPSQVYRWTVAENPPLIGTLESIAKALGLTVVDILKYNINQSELKEPYSLTNNEILVLDTYRALKNELDARDVIQILIREARRKATPVAPDVSRSATDSPVNPRPPEGTNENHSTGGDSE